ncbi:hypothetical protein P692DRAFT_20844680 [Suillus brevipes Sb2]|nr:hypothetical protein P692DRAFT_20844680 [Suillus brevipes Sb2]
MRGFTHASTHPQDFSTCITQNLVNLDNPITPVLVGGGDRAQGFRYHPALISAQHWRWLCHYLVGHKSLFRAEFPAPPGNLLLSPWSYVRQSKHQKYALCQIGLKILGPHGFGFAILNHYISPAYRCTVISRAFRIYSSPSALLIGSLIKHGS